MHSHRHRTAPQLLLLISTVLLRSLLIAGQSHMGSCSLPSYLACSALTSPQVNRERLWDPHFCQACKPCFPHKMDQEGSCSDPGPTSLRHDRDGTQCISTWQMTAWGGEQSHTAQQGRKVCISFRAVPFRERVSPGGK